MQVQPISKTSHSNGEQILTLRQPGWRVALRRAALSGHTLERTEGQDVKVVGDRLAPLKSGEIAKVLTNAPRQFNPELSRETLPWLVTNKESPAPVVIVKKRRVAVMP